MWTLSINIFYLQVLTLLNFFCLQEMVTNLKPNTNLNLEPKPVDVLKKLFNKSFSTTSKTPKRVQSDLSYNLRVESYDFWGHRPPLLLPNLTNIRESRYFWNVMCTSKAQKPVTFIMKSYFYKSLMTEGFKTFYFQALTLC